MSQGHHCKNPDEVAGGDIVPSQYHIESTVEKSVMILSGHNKLLIGDYHDYIQK